MPDRVFVDIEGSEKVRDRLLAMGEAASGMLLIPIIGEVTAEAAALMAALAPKRTGALARGINPSFLKAGVGYCHFEARLAAPVYYGMFQEFGLGDKATRGVSARTERRRAKAAARGLKTRHPNMAAQPFIRPVLFGKTRYALESEIVERIAAQVLEQTGESE